MRVACCLGTRQADPQNCPAPTATGVASGHQIGQSRFPGLFRVLPKRRFAIRLAIPKENGPRPESCEVRRLRRKSPIGSAILWDLPPTWPTNGFHQETTPQVARRNLCAVEASESLPCRSAVHKNLNCLRTPGISRRERSPARAREFRLNWLSVFGW